MPTFNKGEYDGISFNAKPIGKFRALSSAWRWYKPYPPGGEPDFDVVFKPIDGNERSIRMYEFIDGKENEGWSIHIGPEGRVFPVRGRSLSGQGALDYRLGYATESNSKLVASIVATHNDTWTVLLVGGILTFSCTIIGVALTWFLSFISIIPKWNMWMPDILVNFLKSMVE